HDQIDDQPEDDRRADIVDVLEVVAPALPVAANLASQYGEAGDPRDRPQGGQRDEPGERHLADTRGVGHGRTDYRDEARDEYRGGTVAVKPAGCHLQPLLA